MNAIDLRLDDNMQVVRIIPRQNQRQDKEYAYPDFPYISYDIDLEEFMGHHVHLHWHDGFHFLEILSGHLTLRTGNGVQTLSPGTVCFVNVNVLHSLEPIDTPEECRVRAYVFQPDLLSGNWENTLAAKYVHPVLNNPEITLIIFNEDTGARIRSMLHQVLQIYQEKAFGYEFDLRHELTIIWRELLRSIASRLHDTNPMDERLKSRMRTMLSFIRTNYMKKIDLDDIAESALISQRECFRCFKKTLGVTPNHYLQNFRVRSAAHFLLETDDPIASIAMDCGFSDTSYFGKTFQKYMNCSPSEYRKKHHGDYMSPTEETTE